MSQTKKKNIFTNKKKGMAKRARVDGDLILVRTIPTLLPCRTCMPPTLVLFDPFGRSFDIVHLQFSCVGGRLKREM